MQLPIETDTGGGERLRILRIIGEGPTARLEGDVLVDPGAGPPMHVHHFQEEGFRVVEGRLGYQLMGGTAQYLEAGETATFPAGVAHRFWNAGDVPLRTEAWVEPVGNFVWFITRLHASIRRNGGERPGFFDGAFLIHHFRREYDLAEIPTPVKRIVFPVVVLLGRLLGRYSHFADAPAALRADPRAAAGSVAGEVAPVRPASG